jgi:hypothetical protein
MTDSELRAQLEYLASLWQRNAEDNRRVATISDEARYSAGYADAMDCASQGLKGLLTQWQ